MIYREICKVCNIKKEYYEVNWFGNSMLSTLEEQQNAAKQMLSIGETTKSLLKKNIVQTMDDDDDVEEIVLDEDDVDEIVLDEDDVEEPTVNSGMED
jgi:hypothetical protein